MKHLYHTGTLRTAFARIGFGFSLGVGAMLLISATQPKAIARSHQAATGGKSRIAFVRDFPAREDSFIYSIRPDGTGLRKLTDHGSEWSPSWSPDGTKIAFESKQDGDVEIYVMDRNGTNVVQLTNNSSSDVSPAWSPDGEWIAFARSDDSIPDAHIYDIYKMRIDGSGVTQLTSGDAQEWTPAWSADSSRIVFYRDDDLVVMNADGSDKITLDIPHAANSPDWKNSGVTIFYGGDHEAGGSEIHAINADGTGKKRLTRRAGPDQSPSVSPTGTRIAFGRDWNLAVMGADGTRVRTIHEGRGDVYAPDWGPAAPPSKTSSATTLWWSTQQEGTDDRQTLPSPNRPYRRHPRMCGVIAGLERPLPLAIELSVVVDGVGDARRRCVDSE